MVKVKDIKGMKDIFELYPYFRHIEKRSSNVLERKLGYRKILQNTLERSQTFMHTLGISSDIVQKEMYSFTDKGNNDLVLRPEGTAGAMRFLLNNS